VSAISLGGSERLDKLYVI